MSRRDDIAERVREVADAAGEAWTEYSVHEAGELVPAKASGTRTRSLVVSLLKWARAANPNKEFALMARTILASPWEQVTDDE